MVKKAEACNIVPSAADRRTDRQTIRRAGRAVGCSHWSARRCLLRKSSLTLQKRSERILARAERNCGQWRAALEQAEIRHRVCCNVAQW